MFPKSRKKLESFSEPTGREVLKVPKKNNSADAHVTRSKAPGQLIKGPCKIPLSVHKVENGLVNVFLYTQE